MKNLNIDPNHLPQRPTTSLRIFLFGPEGAGKHTVAEYLQKKYNFWIFYITSIIEEVAHFYYGMNVRDYTLLQDVSIGMKNIRQNVWLIALDRILKANWCTKCKHIVLEKNAKYCCCCGSLLAETGYHNKPEHERYKYVRNICIGDVRKNLEYNTLVSWGYIPILVDAPSDLCIKRLKEREMSDYFLNIAKSHRDDIVNFAEKNAFYRILNYSDFDTLYKQVDTMMALLYKKSMY